MRAPKTKLNTCSKRRERESKVRSIRFNTALFSPRPVCRDLAGTLYQLYIKL